MLLGLSICSGLGLAFCFCLLEAITLGRHCRGKASFHRLRALSGECASVVIDDSICNQKLFAKQLRAKSLSSLEEKEMDSPDVSD